MKTNASAFPMRKSTMPSKMGQGPTLKDARSRTSLGGSGFNRNARMALNPNKKEGGVKLLDITEQPIGQAAMKKRKRQQELDDAKKFAEESAKTEASKAENSANAANSSSSTNKSKETPDYAVGLSTLNPPTPAPNPPAYAPPTPAYAPPTPAMPVTVANVAPNLSGSSMSVATPASTSTVLIQPPQQTIPQPQQQTPQPQLPTTPLPLTSATPSLPTQPLPPVSTQPTQQQTTSTRLSTIPLGLNQLQPLPQSALAPQPAPSAATIVARLPTQPQPRAQLTQATARIVQLPTQPIPQNRVAQMTAARPQVPPVSVLQPGARIIRTIQTPTQIGGAPRQVIIFIFLSASVKVGFLYLTNSYTQGRSKGNIFGVAKSR